MKKIDYDWWKRYWWLLTIIIVPLVIVGLITYGYSKDNQELPLTAIGVVTGIEALIITSFFQNKTNQTDGLMRAFGKLNDEKHRNNRRLIFRTYLDVLKKSEVEIKLEDIQNKNFEPSTDFLRNSTDEKLRKAVESVRADYDEIGSMMKNHLLPKKPFMEVYWGSVIRAWFVLYANTKHVRDDVLSSYFMVFFGHLFNEAVDYWNEKHSDKTVKVYKADIFEIENMSHFVGERFIQCLNCKQEIPLPENSIPWNDRSFSVRYELKNKKLCLYAKCQNPNCEYDNFYHADELLHGRSTEVK